VQTGPILVLQDSSLYRISLQRRYHECRIFLGMVFTKFKHLVFFPGVSLSFLSTSQNDGRFAVRKSKVVACST
jgi:hypothetical protein